MYSIWYLSHRIAICRYRGIVGTDLSVLWVAYAVVNIKAENSFHTFTHPKATVK